MDRIAVGIRDAKSEITDNYFFNSEDKLVADSDEQRAALIEELITKIGEGQIYGVDSLYYDSKYNVNKSDDIYALSIPLLSDNRKEQAHKLIITDLENIAETICANSFVNQVLTNMETKQNQVIRVFSNASNEAKRIALVVNQPENNFITTLRDRYFTPPEFYCKGGYKFAPEESVRNILDGITDLINHPVTGLEKTFIELLDNSEGCRSQTKYDNNHSRILIGVTDKLNRFKIDWSDNLRNIMTGLLGTTNDIPVYTDALRLKKHRSMKPESMYHLPDPSNLGVFTNRGATKIKISHTYGEIDHSDSFRIGQFNMDESQLPKHKDTELYAWTENSLVVFLDAQEREIDQIRLKKAG